MTVSRDPGTGWKSVWLIALLAVALSACQSPRTTRPTQDVTPPVTAEQIPQYPWPAPRVTTRPTGTLPAWATTPPAEAEPEALPERRILPGTVVRVGVLLPLSGPNGELGKAILNAAQLAMFAFADQTFELMPFDTQGTPEGAEAAAQAAVGEGSLMLLGPLLAPSVRAAAPYAQAAGVPLISFSSDRTVAGGGVYTMGFLPSEQVRRVTGHALSRGITVYAALAPANTYGETVVEAFREALELGGGVLERVRYYDPAATDFADVIKDLGDFEDRRKALLEELELLEGKEDEISVKARERLEQLQTLGDPAFEALLVADGGKRLQAVAAMLPFYDIDPKTVRMLGTGLWDVPGLGAEPALMGGWYAAPTPAAREAFEAEYAEVYGTKPPRLATLGYDATALVAVLARADGGAGFGHAALTDPSGFAGRDGVFRFAGQGVAERRLAVLRVERHGATVISVAPTSFEPALY